jgi:hypothetical protein
MDRTISSNLRTIFMVHMIIALILGAALWLVPGRALELLGWVDEMVPLPESEVSVPGGTFVDGVITRLLGAAMLALAYGSWRASRALRWEQIAPVVELELVFSTLGLVGALAGLYLLERPVPLIGWVIAALLAIFTLLWGWSLRR